MENLLIAYNAANDEFQGMVDKGRKLENQITILMDLMKIPEDERNFEELKKRIEKMIEEKDISTTQNQSENDDIESMAEVSPLEKILNNPGLVHLAENIFSNLDCNGTEICRNINQSLRQMLDSPMFWLRKFEELSKENQKDWIKVVQSMNNSEMEKAIIPYLQWNLKNGRMDLPCKKNWICCYFFHL